MSTVSKADCRSPSERDEDDGSDRGGSDVDAGASDGGDSDDSDDGGREGREDMGGKDELGR
ncbi:MAG: hypothetical protein ABEK75_00645, partial [Salinibacter sp.]